MQREPPTGDWLRWEEGSHPRPTSSDTRNGHQQSLTKTEAWKCRSPPWRDRRGICIDTFPTLTLNLAKTLGGGVGWEWRWVGVGVQRGRGHI